MPGQFTTRAPLPLVVNREPTVSNGFTPASSVKEDDDDVDPLETAGTPPPSVVNQTPASLHRDASFPIAGTPAPVVLNGTQRPLEDSNDNALTDGGEDENGVDSSSDEDEDEDEGAGAGWRLPTGAAFGAATDDPIPDSESGLGVVLCVQPETWARVLDTHGADDLLLVVGGGDEWNTLLPGTPLALCVSILADVDDESVWADPVDSLHVIVHSVLAKLCVRSVAGLPANAVTWTNLSFLDTARALTRLNASVTATPSPFMLQTTPEFVQEVASAPGAVLAPSSSVVVMTPDTYLTTMRRGDLPVVTDLVAIDYDTGAVTVLVVGATAGGILLPPPSVSVLKKTNGTAPVAEIVSALCEKRWFVDFPRDDTTFFADVVRRLTSVVWCPFLLGPVRLTVPSVVGGNDASTADGSVTAYDWLTSPVASMGTWEWSTDTRVGICTLVSTNGKTWSNVVDTKTGAVLLVDIESPPRKSTTTCGRLPTDDIGILSRDVAEAFAAATPDAWWETPTATLFAAVATFFLVHTTLPVMSFLSTGTHMCVEKKRRVVKAYASLLGLATGRDDSSLDDLRAQVVDCDSFRVTRTPGGGDIPILISSTLASVAPLLTMACECMSSSGARVSNGFSASVGVTGVQSARADGLVSALLNRPTGPAAAVDDVVDTVRAAATEIVSGYLLPLLDGVDKEVVHNAARNLYAAMRALSMSGVDGEADAVGDDSRVCRRDSSSTVIRVADAITLARRGELPFQRRDLKGSGAYGSSGSHHIAVTSAISVPLPRSFLDLAPPVHSGEVLQVLGSANGGSIRIVRDIVRPESGEAAEETIKRGMHLLTPWAHGDRVVWNDEIDVASALGVALAKEDAQFSMIVARMTTLPQGVTAILTHGVSRLVAAVISSTQVRTRSEAVSIVATALDMKVYSAAAAAMSQSVFNSIALAVDDALAAMDWVDLERCGAAKLVTTVVAMFVWATSPPTFNIQALPSTGSGRAIRERAEKRARRGVGAGRMVSKRRFTGFVRRVEEAKERLDAEVREESRRVAAVVEARARPSASTTLGGGGEMVIDPVLHASTEFLVTVDGAMKRVCTALFRAPGGTVAKDVADGLSSSSSPTSDGTGSSVSITEEDVMGAMRGYFRSNVVSGTVCEASSFSPCVRRIIDAKTVGGTTGPLPPALQPVAMDMQVLFTAANEGAGISVAEPPDYCVVASAYRFATAVADGISADYY